MKTLLATLGTVALLLAPALSIAQQSDAREQAQQLMNQARTMTDANRKIDLLRQAAGLWPAVNSYVQLASALEDASRYQNARDEYRHAYELALAANGQKHAAALLLGQISSVFEKEKRPLDALKTAESAAALDPTDKRFPEIVKRLQLQLSNTVLSAEDIHRGFETTREYEVEGGDGGVSINLYINFAFDSDRLTPQGDEQARQLGQAMTTAGYSGRKFEVIGHTDQQGSDEYNLGLSSRRAATVKNYLVSQNGIAASKLTVRGLGKTHPLRTGTTEEDYAINRRVEVRLLDN
jgi:outer membrane protein OmpA-like peptidoglycan-associated protein